MPIVDIQIVAAPAQTQVSPPTQALADALGRVFDTAPGRTWVRVHALPSSQYAENDCALGEDELPVFVTLLHARSPRDNARASEARAVTEAVAQVLHVANERVHVQYAPDGAGRQAFGRLLVE